MFSSHVILPFFALSRLPLSGRPRTQPRHLGGPYEIAQNTIIHGPQMPKIRDLLHYAYSHVDVYHVPLPSKLLYSGNILEAGIGTLKAFLRI